MQECFEKHPEEYGKYADTDNDDEETEDGDGTEQKGEDRTEKEGDKEAAAKDQGQTKSEVTEGEQTPEANAS